MCGRVGVGRRILTFFPKENGTYLCLIMCLICFFIVTVNSMIQYSNSTGQNTGKSNMGKKVMVKPINNDFIAARLSRKGKSGNQNQSVSPSRVLGFDRR